MTIETWAIDDAIDVHYDPNNDGSNGQSGPCKSVVFGPQSQGKNDEQQADLPSLVDDHEGLTDEELDELIKEMNDILSDEEKDDIREIVDEHCQNEENAPKEDEDGDDDSQGEKGEPKQGDPQGGGKQAGKGSGNIWTFADVNPNRVKKKKKWETVIKKWVMQKLSLQYRETEQWARIKPRFSEMMADGDLIIPTEMEVEDMYWDEERITVFLMLDYSGSCVHLKDRFFKAAASIPPEKFDVRLFTFDTRMYETTLESRKVYGGGGTSFSCIENKIQEIMKKEGIKYPSVCFIITDGYADRVSPQFPDRWWFFLSGDYRHCIPEESHVHLLKDYE